MTKFTVERMRCDCHPETCCCAKYYLANEKGTNLAWSNDKENLDTICEALNTLMEWKKKLCE